MVHEFIPKTQMPGLIRSTPMRHRRDMVSKLFTRIALHWTKSHRRGLVEHRQWKAV